MRSGMGRPSGGAGSSYAPSAVTSETTVSVTTTATAADSAFVIFASQECTELEIDNDTGATLEYQRSGAGETVILRPGQIRRVVGITNANQIGVRRADWTTPTISRPTVVTARAITSTETFSVAGILSVAITNGGANTQAGSLACSAAEIMNPTGKIVIWRIGTTAAYRKLKEGESVVINGITNTNELYFKFFDSVASSINPVKIEAFNSALRSPLNPIRQSRQVAPDARILLDDYAQPSKLGAEKLFLSVLETGDQKKTLQPKNAQYLARFTAVANSVLSHPAQCADSTNGEFLFGSSAIEYTQSGSNVTSTFAENSVLSAGIDVTDSDIHIEYCFPGNSGTQFSTSNITGFFVELHSAGTPSSPTANYHEATLAFSQGFLRVDDRTGGTIIGYSIPIAAFTAVGTGATLTSLIFARFRLQGGAASGARFRPHSIKAVKRARTKAGVVFVFDDMHIGQYTNALPILSKYNYPACIGVDTVNKLGATNFMTPGQLVTLHQKHGWQMIGQVQGGNGAGINSDKGISPEHAITQMARFKGAMKALGISDAQDYSFGSTSMTSADGITGNYFDTWPVMKRLFRSSVTFYSGNNTNPPMRIAETVPFGEPHHIRRLGMNGFTATTWQQRWQEQTDYVISTKGVVVWGAHGEFNAPGEGLTALAGYVEYLRTQELAGNLEVLTMAELIESVY